LFYSFLLQNPEDFSGKVGVEDVLRDEDIAGFFLGKAVEFGVEGVEFGLEPRTANLVPLEQ